MLTENPIKEPQTSGDCPRALTRSVNSQNPIQHRSPHEQVRVTRSEFAQVLAQLCAMKRTAEFTTPAVWAWYAVLCIFPVEVLTCAVIRLGLEQVRFPELADVYVECKREAAKRGIMRRRWAPNATGSLTTPTDSEIHAIAERMNLPS